MGFLQHIQSSYLLIISIAKQHQIFWSELCHILLCCPVNDYVTFFHKISTSLSTWVKIIKDGINSEQGKNVWSCSFYCEFKWRIQEDKYFSSV